MMVMHTDEPHPHVHMVVKAVSEQGVRLKICKATLREWQREFARHLREQGVAANATERRGDSSHMRERVRAVDSEAGQETDPAGIGKSQLTATRLDIVRGWEALERQLLQEGHAETAMRVGRFIAQMPPPLTDREQLTQLSMRADQLH